VRAGDVEKPMTVEMLEQMPYLMAFVKESMRVKPPVTMVCATNYVPHFLA
jgi:sterol 22-desaturase